MDIFNQAPGDRPPQSPGPQTEPDEAVVDLARMQDLVDSLGDALREIIDSYLEDAPAQIEALRAAFERGDWDDLQRVAHTLKSSSGIFGAHQLVELCQALEVGAQAGGMAGSEPVLAITGAYKKVQAVLNLYR